MSEASPSPAKPLYRTARQVQFNISSKEVRGYRRIFHRPGEKDHWAFMCRRK